MALITSVGSGIDTMMNSLIDKAALVTKHWKLQVRAHTTTTRHDPPPCPVPLSVALSVPAQTDTDSTDTDTDSTDR